MLVVVLLVLLLSLFGKLVYFLLSYLSIHWLGRLTNSVSRAGFYAENLLNYSLQAKDGVLPLPIGPNHKFAPIALGVSWRNHASYELLRKG